MRIVVNGQQAFGAEVLKALREHGEDVVAVYCGTDRDGQPPDPLAQEAHEEGIEVRQVESFETPEVAEELAALRPDLMVMAFVTLLVPESVLTIPTYGAIQYHPSLLPRHRGPSAINWAIIHGDATTGIAVFWPDEGLDTGPVLMTREVPISPDDTLGSLYFDKLFPLGVEAMVESVDLVRAGRAPRIAQDEALATYEGWCGKGDVELDWRSPVAQVYDLIRGADPRPGAWTTVQGEQVEVLGCEPVASEPGAPPGQVLAIDGERLVVAAADGAIAIRTLRPDGERIPAAEYARSVGIEPGHMLGGQAASASGSTPR